MAIFIDNGINVANVSPERNMFVKSFVVGAAGAFALIKMEMKARSHATSSPAH